MQVDFDGEGMPGLDEGIKKEVLLLQKNGFATFMSCQGGQGHAFKLPIIQMFCDEGKTAEETRERLAATLSEVGYTGFTTSVHYAHADSKNGRFETDSYVGVEFWKETWIGTECQNLWEVVGRNFPVVRCCNIS